MLLKFKNLFLFTCIILFSNNIYSQVIDPDAIGYYSEAIRYAQTMNTGGTARFQAMGGTKSALGADLSSISGNPAGLGLYKKSEASISTAFGFAGTTSSFLNNSTKDQRDYFNFPNLGLVLCSRNDETEEGAVRGGAFGIGLTRINNFQNQFSYSGINSKNSMTDYFVDIATGIPAQKLYDENNNITTLQGLGYWTYLIDGADPNDFSRTDYITYNKGTTSKQEESVLTRGAMNQWNFSYGSSFEDKVYIGASLGVPMIRSVTEKNYKETVIDNDTMDMNFKFSESVKVKGTGVNFKLGVILKPKDWIRIGVTLQSPTYYSINEDYQYSIKSAFNNVMAVPLNDYTEKTNPGTFKYHLINPFRASAGIALFAGKEGFIAADIEYVPYSQSVLKEASLYKTTDNSTFIGDNKTIKNLYKSAINFNVGGEWRYKIYRFRAGFAMLGNAYNNIDNTNRKVINISGGTGIRLDDYYFDIALVNSRYNSLYKPYTLNNGLAPTAALKNTNTSFVITAGVFF